VTNENVAASAPVNRLVGRALDVLVAVHVMGWTEEPGFGLMNVEQFMEIDGPFCPSSNIKDAWAVVQRMSVIKQRNSIWWNCTAGAFVCIDMGGDEFPKSLARIMYDCPDKMPLAICLAALESFGVSPNATDHRADAQESEK
jgi:hypothetical protein